MKKLELVATMAMGVVLAGIISIDPMKAAEKPEIEVFVPTWEQCLGDMEADWESKECRALQAVKWYEDQYGPEYYNDYNYDVDEYDEHEMEATL